MAEIKPCPRCGSTRGKVVLTGVRKCYAHLFCPVCRLEGVKYPYPDEGGEALMCTTGIEEIEEIEF